ncbi:MAG TPA: UPF0158 family protein [Anaerolineae bacterium]
MKKLPISRFPLEMAFDNSSWEMSYYLDLETGEVLVVTDEARRQLEAIYEEYYDPDAPEDFDMDAALAQSGLRDWQQQDVREADRVEAEFGSRVVAIPRVESHEAYDDMQRFIATIEDARLYNRLVYATQGRGAFGRFRDVLWEYAAERERWFAFKDARLQERIRDWLALHDIEPILDEPELEAMPGEETASSTRSKLLAEVLAFVQAAREIPGVTRVALIGSLATTKPDPSDADLLVTVTNEADLAPLAAEARKLQGHTQSMALGGEVFLADPDHYYLGRTCPWKRCERGIRVSCEAQHCARINGL